MKSFDVFDTVITRNTATPNGIFAIMQHRLMYEEKFLSIYQKTLDNWCIFRKEAESYARTQKNAYECTLDEIYDCIKEMLGFSNEEVEKLKQLELETEMMNVVGVDENIRKIKECIRQKEKVVLISDMYLSEETIRNMLVKVDEIFRDIPIYVSSQYRCNKFTGELFCVVKEKEKQDTWIHIGDNEKSDVIGANIAGIKGIRYKFEPLLEHEENALLEKEMDAVTQVLVGVARNYRLNGCRNIAEKAGSSLGTEILLPYVYWVLDICKLRGINKLFFVARDGYIIKRLADLIIENQKLNICTSYLYGSRSVWMDIDADIDINDEQRFAKRDRARKYICQEIQPAIQENTIGFVEIHGSGKTQEHLCNYLTGICKSSLVNFYYHTNSVAWRNPKKSTYYRYYKEFTMVEPAIEMFTRALHGRTIDYMLVDNKYIPILEDSDEGKSLNDSDYGDYINSIWENGKQMIDIISSNKIHMENSTISKTYFAFFIKEQKDDIFEYFCNLPFTDGDSGEKFYNCLSPKLSRKDIRDIYLKVIIDKNAYSMALKKVHYMDFSIRRCDEKDLKLIEKYKKLADSSLARDIEKKKYKLIRKESDIKRNIVVYCAGKIGTSLVKKINDLDTKQLVLWVDSDAFKMQSNKNVKPVEKLHDVKFDQVIIAVKNFNSMLEIKSKLVSMGIPARKIYWRNSSEWNM